MIDFCVVRHGYSVSNAARTFTGALDEPLSELGKRQAERLADFLQREYTFDAIYCSDLIRAQATVAPYAARVSLPLRTDARLREIDGGVWQGKTVPEILAETPDEYKVWQTDLGNVVCPGGESMRAVQARGLAALHDVFAAHDGGRVLVCAHAGIIRALQCAFCGLPIEAMQNIPWVPNASVTDVRYDGRTFTPVRIGYDDFLAGDCTRLTGGF